jgi:hypothetical protein
MPDTTKEKEHPKIDTSNIEEEEDDFPIYSILGIIDGSWTSIRKDT